MLYADYQITKNETGEELISKKWKEVLESKDLKVKHWKTNNDGQWSHYKCGLSKSKVHGHVMKRAIEFEVECQAKVKKHTQIEQQQ